jgi:hypothetical protein
MLEQIHVVVFANLNANASENFDVKMLVNVHQIFMKGLKKVESCQ